MSQPQWETVANLGDANPIDHGGYFVFVDETGVYPPEAELLREPCEDGPQVWEVFRFVLEPCTFIGGILSDNRFHPDHPAWFADGLQGVASTMDVPLDELILWFCSDNPISRANAWRNVGEYHGFENLDSYPLRLSESEISERYPEFTD